ncbi:MAG TPA: hypothetical protein VLG45_01560 [Thermodesulfobacteriota bacterium]|nr:hypothetical protein [Thermodesulfobacteriota bacterium]
MRAEGSFYIPFMILPLFLSFAFKTVTAQTTDVEIKLIKEKIEQLNQRLRELEAEKSSEEREGGARKGEASIPDPVTFLNSSGAGIKKTSEPEISKTLFTGGGALNLTDSDDPRKFNASFSPLFHRQLANNLHLVLKPEFNIEEDKFGVGLGVGEVDFFLNDFITLRGGKLLSPSGVLSEQTYTSWLNNAKYLPDLYPRTENRPSQDILSDLRNIGFGVSGGIPIKFFKGTSIDYGISLVNGINGPGTLNFSFSISEK